MPAHSSLRKNLRKEFLMVALTLASLITAFRHNKAVIISGFSEVSKRGIALLLVYSTVAATMPVRADEVNRADLKRSAISTSFPSLTALTPDSGIMNAGPSVTSAIPARVTGNQALKSNLARSSVEIGAALSTHPGSFHGSSVIAGMPELPF